METSDEWTKAAAAAGSRTTGWWVSPAPKRAPMRVSEYKLGFAALALFLVPFVYFAFSRAMSPSDMSAVGSAVGLGASDTEATNLRVLLVVVAIEFLAICMLIATGPQERRARRTREWVLNAPPGWPAPPPGFVVPTSIRLPAEWPEPPRGWRFWVIAPRAGVASPTKPAPKASANG